MQSLCALATSNNKLYIYFFLKEEVQRAVSGWQSRFQADDAATEDEM